MVLEITVCPGSVGILITWVDLGNDPTISKSSQQYISELSNMYIIAASLTESI